MKGRPLLSPQGLLSRHLALGLLLVVALAAFELFNFDTTRFALLSVLGEVSFAGIRWASILAFAFSAIDFAGLAHLFTPETGRDEPKEIWFLMGAWLLGATLNALMTWWAVSLTLLEQEIGNDILSREQLLNSVPIFVATLVWLTRILFIGAFSVAGEHLFRAERPARTMQPAQLVRQAQRREHPLTAPVEVFDDEKSDEDAPGLAGPRSHPGAEPSRPRLQAASRNH